MCGAFSIVIGPRYWGEFFDVTTPEKWQSIYNARPGEVLPIITQQAPQTTTPALWNYMPHWLKDVKRGGVINARAEGIAAKPYFRGSLQSQRCIIPADGFYEWQRKGKVKIPYRFVRADGLPFGFAGLYDELPDHSGNIGFTIITTAANSLVGSVHERMPVVFDRDDEQRWIDSSVSVPKALELLRPFPSERMKMFPVSRRVNVAANKDASVIEPVTAS